MFGFIVVGNHLVYVIEHGLLKRASNSLFCFFGNTTEAALIIIKMCSDFDKLFVILFSMEMIEHVS